VKCLAAVILLSLFNWLNLSPVVFRVIDDVYVCCVIDI